MGYELKTWFLEVGIPVRAPHKNHELEFYPHTTTRCLRLNPKLNGLLTCVEVEGSG
jgi:hypothetical protein